MTVAIPYTFVGGTTIVAAQVNADFAGIVNALNANTRTLLTVDTIFNVSPGMSPAGPSATPVSDTIALLFANYDLNNHVATIKLADGTYNESVLISGLVPGQYRPGQLSITGNVGSPANVLFTGAPPFFVNNGGGCSVSGMRISSPSSDGIVAGNFATMFWSALDFGACVGSHIHASRRGFMINIGDYSISGAAAIHWNAGNGDILVQQPVTIPVAPTPGLPTITLTGTPAFGTAFAFCANVSLVRVLATFTGSATGARFLISGNSVIDTASNGAGVNYLPGNSAGSTNSGGQYI